MIILICIHFIRCSHLCRQHISPNANKKQIVRIFFISKSFPGVKALEEVNLELRSGEVMALLGENGAGKSTLMKILSGIYMRDSGVIHILGSDMIKHGEIAEQFDVLRRNCLRILNGLKADATFDNVGRTAPEDYIVAGQAVQSKYYNGINNTLKAALEHNA